MSGVSVSGLTTNFAKKFGKEKKQREKIAVCKKKEHYSRIVKAKYKQIIIELTELPEDRVEDFIAFCNLGESFIYEALECEIVVAVAQCYTQFIFCDK